MRLVYEVGDVIRLVERGTMHRVVSEFFFNDPVLGPQGVYQYLGLEPPGPSDVFDSTDARRVIPVTSGLLFYSQGRPVGLTVLPQENAEPQAQQLRGQGWSVMSLPVHLDVSPATHESFRRLSAAWFK